MSQQLISRLKMAVERWPVLRERSGRDLGEFLQTTYLGKFSKLANSGTSDEVWMAKRQVEAIEDILDNKFKTEFPRKADSTFTGDAGRKHYTKLSSQSQETYNKDGFIAKMLKKSSNKKKKE
eukprot:m.138254 g.138254  ORF g.138254 m.138254 type:complete len:122 (-) comp13835_c0_seq1:47-412(-)